MRPSVQTEIQVVSSRPVPTSPRSSPAQRHSNSVYRASAGLHVLVPSRLILSVHRPAQRHSSSVYRASGPVSPTGLSRVARCEREHFSKKRSHGTVKQL
jgi:hypothetical protein